MAGEPPEAVAPVTEQQVKEEQLPEEDEDVARMIRIAEGSETPDGKVNPQGLGRSPAGDYYGAYQLGKPAIKDYLDATGRSGEADKWTQDEWDAYRRGPEAKKAAVWYIRKYAKLYGDIQAGAAAYNWGPGNVKKAMARAKKENTDWRIYLPKETARYIRNFS